MVLCLAGHHPVLSIGGNARRQGLKTTFAVLCRPLQVSPLGRFWLLNCGLLNIIASYYKKNELQSPGQFECHAGAAAHVMLRGEFVKIAD
jgi:hypothetical protein